MSRRVLTGALIVTAAVLLAWTLHGVDAITFLKRMHGQ